MEIIFEIRNKNEEALKCAFKPKYNVIDAVADTMDDVLRVGWTKVSNSKARDVNLSNNKILDGAASCKFGNITTQKKVESVELLEINGRRDSFSMGVAWSDDILRQNLEEKIWAAICPDTPPVIEEKDAPTSKVQRQITIGNDTKGFEVAWMTH